MKLAKAIGTFIEKRGDTSRVLEEGKIYKIDGPHKRKNYTWSPIKKHDTIQDKESYYQCCALSGDENIWIPKSKYTELLEDIKGNLITETVFEAKEEDFLNSYLEELVKKLQSFKDKKYFEMYTDCEIEKDYGYYNDVSVSFRFRVQGLRFETKEEEEKRFEDARQAKIKAEKKKQKALEKAAKTQKTLYETLKKKYEKGATNE